MAVYSIRIALLREGEEGALSAAERGFETAQLNTRHWIITRRDGEVEQVDGAGVVGRFPLFREGGWREDRQTDAYGQLRIGDECDGLFVYQSMSGRGAMCAHSDSMRLKTRLTGLTRLTRLTRLAYVRRSTFEGEISMVPGTIAAPQGDEFRIAVARFPIACGPDEFMF